MLAMYDEIAIELDAEQRDCETAAEALRRAISDHASDVKEWVTEQRALPVAERKTEQAHSADGARMQAARKALNASLERCSSNAQFVGAFQQLGALSSDS